MASSEGSQSISIMNLHYIYGILPTGDITATQYCALSEYDHPYAYCGANLHQDGERLLDDRSIHRDFYGRTN